MPDILPNWHPIVVHFAIALLFTAAVLFVGGSLLRGRPLGAAATVAARWDLTLGTAAALLALATGWHAYDTVVHDEAGHANMTIHMHWAFATVGLFLVATALSWLDRRRLSGAGAALGLALALGCAGLVVTGWLGAENVYRYGIGVLSLPKPDHHHHHHGDHDDHDQDTSPQDGAPADVPATAPASSPAPAR